MKLLPDNKRTIKFYTDEDGTTGITELGVYRSAAGYYIGRYCDEGPYSRESVGYYKTRDLAQAALDSEDNSWFVYAYNLKQIP